MENDNTGPHYCGNILVRRSKRRSFINKVAFEGVFGVLSNTEFKYYRSSSDWSSQEKPQFSIQHVDIQAVEPVDDVAFNRPLCFQIIFTNHSKKDKPTRSVYLAAYETDEQKSWITSIRTACIDNPIMLTYYHPGRFTGKTWVCCSEGKVHCGCKSCTIQGLPVMLSKKPKIKVSPAIEFFGFTVIANEGFDSNLPGFLPFDQGDRLTVTEAAGKQEWKAFSTSSTSEYGLIPCQSVSVADITQEPFFFNDIPCGLATALLREQEAGCFILRRHSTSAVNILSIRTENAVKHVEIVFDESSQKFRIKDGSESVSYANFLQFDTIQQLLDQCKQHPTLGVSLDKYPSIQAVDELWKIDWSEIFTVEELKTDLPWVIMEGKFRNQNALIHIQQLGCSDPVKEGFTNQARIQMTLSHENLVEFHGIGSKGSRIFMVHSHYPNGQLSDYLTRNASLLISHPSELVNIITQILTAMVYLEQCGVVHGELIADNCLIGDKGAIKLCGFHCASSLWCSKPLQEQLYSNKIPIPAPELDEVMEPSSKTDVWAFGLLVYTILTAGQKPIKTIEQVLSILDSEDILEQFEGLVEMMTSCLRMDSSYRPTFAQLLHRCGVRISSTPSASSHSLELDDSFSSCNGVPFNGLQSSMNSDTSLKEFDEKRPNSENFEHTIGTNVSQSETSSFDSTNKNTVRLSSGDVMERLKSVELEALKAKALQRRAEADKDEVLSQVGEAEKKCLKEVELLTRTFICRLNEANDRTAEANEMRYVAEEAKRLAEEKFTLYKYESEKTIHGIKSMFEETMLERDELAQSLKSFGMNIDENIKTPERRHSLSDLERKYQKFVSTSDRTIQNMKTQLDDVVHQRDLLTEELNSSRMELRQNRSLLEQVIKERDDFAFRLDEANCEVEKLEETISSMVHKREKAERERDQLQILTDMSLMKLRHVERPKKRHSIGSVSVVSREKRDPNLRRLSVQLMNLRTPTPKRRLSADVIYEVSEHSSSEEMTFSHGNDSDDENHSIDRESSKEENTSPDVHELRCSTPKDLDSDAELLSSVSNLTSSDYVMDMLRKEHQENKTHTGIENMEADRVNNIQNNNNIKKTNKQLPLNETNENDFVENSESCNVDNDFNDKSEECNGDPENGDDDNCHGNDDDDCDKLDKNHGNNTGNDGNERSYNSDHANSCPNNSDDSNYNNRQLGSKTSLPYPIPTVLIDEFREDDVTGTASSQKDNQPSIPEIAISLVDDDFTGNGYFSEDENTNERVFIVPLENGDTSMIFSFDSEGGPKKGVPQTVL